MSFMSSIDATLDVLLEKIYANDPSLTYVMLSRGMNGEDARRIAEALKTNTRVTTLDFMWHDIGDACTRAMAGALRSNSSVRKVDLRGNRIGADGAMAIADLLLDNSSITELDLCYNSIGNEGAAALAWVLRCENSTVTALDLRRNAIGDEGAKLILEALYVNASITYLWLQGNDTRKDLTVEVDELLKINRDEADPQVARRLKVKRRIDRLLSSEGGSEDEADEAAALLALDELGSFPQDAHRGLFALLLGSPEHGARVATAVDADTSKSLYWYAAECAAAPVVLMNLLRAHPRLCACRDVRQKLYPFMLLATMDEAGTGDVLELLLQSPSLVETGIN